jgi:CheY-like chemotaxis protein
MKWIFWRLPKQSRGKKSTSVTPFRRKPAFERLESRCLLSTGLDPSLLSDPLPGPDADATTSITLVNVPPSDAVPSDAGTTAPLPAQHHHHHTTTRDGLTVPPADTISPVPGSDLSSGAVTEGTPDNGASDPGAAQGLSALDVSPQPMGVIVSDDTSGANQTAADSGSADNNQTGNDAQSDGGDQPADSTSPVIGPDTAATDQVDQVNPVNDGTGQTGAANDQQASAVPSPATTPGDTQTGIPATNDDQSGADLSDQGRSSDAVLSDTGLPVSTPDGATGQDQIAILGMAQQDQAANPGIDQSDPAQQATVAYTSQVGDQQDQPPSQGADATDQAQEITTAASSGPYNHAQPYQPVWTSPVDTNATSTDRQSAPDQRQDNTVSENAPGTHSDHVDENSRALAVAMGEIGAMATHAGSLVDAASPGSLLGPSNLPAGDKTAAAVTATTRGEVLENPASAAAAARTARDQDWWTGARIDKLFTQQSGDHQANTSANSGATGWTRAAPAAPSAQAARGRLTKNAATIAPALVRGVGLNDQSQSQHFVDPAGWLGIVSQFVLAPRFTNRPQATVMLAVGDEATRDAMNIVLVQAGYMVLPAGTARDALGLLRTPLSPIDVALLDVQLPDVSGIHLCSRLREIYPKLPVMVCAENPEPNEMVQLLQMGVHHFFLKPFSMGELLATVRAIVS